MPCIALPTVTAPTLPDPLSISPPAVPGAAFDLQLCCKLPPFVPPLPPIPIPALILNSAVVAALNVFIGQAVAFISALSVPCPKE
jgi:hypothetical protein